MSTSGRKVLAEALATALPGWQIVADARQLDSVRKPGALVMFTQKRKKLPALGLDWLSDEVVLQIITAAEKADQIEDDLDDLSLQVLEALEPLTAFTWDTAERVVVADAFHAWQLTVTCAFRVESVPDEPEPEPEPQPEET